MNPISKRKLKNLVNYATYETNEDCDYCMWKRNGECYLDENCTLATFASALIVEGYLKLKPRKEHTK